MTTTGLAAVLTRGLAAAGLAGLATLAVAGPASAATIPCPTGTYPPGVACTTGTGLTLSTQVVAVAGTFSAHSTGWRPGSTVTVQVHSTPVTLGTLVADSAGAVDGTFTLPASVPAGQHTVTAGGASASGATTVLAAPLTVTAGVAAQAASTPRGSLPFTGTQAGVAAVTGLGLVGAGTAAVLAGRRRRATAGA